MLRLVAEKTEENTRKKLIQKVRQNRENIIFFSFLFLSSKQLSGKPHNQGENQITEIPNLHIRIVENQNTSFLFCFFLRNYNATFGYRESKEQWKKYRNPQTCKNREMKFSFCLFFFPSKQFSNNNNLPPKKETRRRWFSGGFWISDPKSQCGPARLSQLSRLAELEANSTSFRTVDFRSTASQYGGVAFQLFELNK